jgi:hypothetical protein
MEIRNLLTRLDTLLVENLTLNSINTAINPYRNNEKVRLDILASLAQENNLPGLYDPITGEFVDVDGDSTDDPDEEDVKTMADRGLLPQNAKMASTGMFANDEVKQKSDAARREMSQIVNAQNSKNEYDPLSDFDDTMMLSNLMNQYIKLQGGVTAQTSQPTQQAQPTTQQSQTSQQPATANTQTSQPTTAQPAAPQQAAKKPAAANQILTADATDKSNILGIKLALVELGLLAKDSSELSTLTITPKSAAAIKEAQKKMGLAETGTINDEFIAVLNEILTNPDTPQIAAHGQEIKKIIDADRKASTVEVPAPAANTYTSESKIAKRLCESFGYFESTTPIKKPVAKPATKPVRLQEHQIQQPKKQQFESASDTMSRLRTIVVEADLNPQQMMKDVQSMSQSKDPQQMMGWVQSMANGQMPVGQMPDGQINGGQLPAWMSQDPRQAIQSIKSGQQPQNWDYSTSTDSNYSYDSAHPEKNTNTTRTTSSGQMPQLANQSAQQLRSQIDQLMQKLSASKKPETQKLLQDYKAWLQKY